MTTRAINEHAATFRLVPWLTIDLDVDTVGVGPRLFVFNIPGTIALFINISVKVFGFVVLFGHISMI